MMYRKQMKTEPLTPKEKIRVAHVLFSLEPGGLENGVVNIANQLDRDQFETVFYCLSKKGEFASRLREDVSVHCMDKPSGISPRTVVRLLRRIRKDSPDVLHTHNLGALIYGVAATIASFTFTPILHGEHGVFRGEDLTRRRLAIRTILYRFCKMIHTVSRSLLEFLVGMGLPAGRLTAILNGVDCGRYLPPQEKKSAKRGIGLPEESEVIGMVGRLIASKRHVMMLEAFESIAARRPHAFLLIVGDTGEAKEAILSAISRHPFRDRIRWEGHQSDPLPFYQAMDLLVMPSSKEGLSNALLEAMACGVPCLAHPACGAKEVIADGRNGMLREMNEPEDVSSGVIELLSKQDRRVRLGEKARRTAESDFSLERMVEQYSRLYTTLAGSKLPT